MILLWVIAIAIIGYGAVCSLSNIGLAIAQLRSDRHVSLFPPICGFVFGAGILIAPIDPFVLRLKIWGVLVAFDILLWLGCGLFTVVFDRDSNKNS